MTGLQDADFGLQDDDAETEGRDSGHYRRSDGQIYYWDLFEGWEDEATAWSALEPYQLRYQPEEPGIYPNGDAGLFQKWNGQIWEGGTATAEEWVEREASGYSWDFPGLDITRDQFASDRLREISANEETWLQTAELARTRSFDQRLDQAHSSQQINSIVRLATERRIALDENGIQRSRARVAQAAAQEALAEAATAARERFWFRIYGAAAIVIIVALLITFVHSETRGASDATAECEDGTYSYSANHEGTCSHHGGVMKWLNGN